MSQMGFLFNADECANCKACMVACKDIHDLPVGYKYRKVLTAEAGSWEKQGESYVKNNVFSYSISISCNHCKMPACFAACPQGAIEKDASTGIMSVDSEKCIGCGTCVKVCPYEAPVVLPSDHKAHRCDFCVDRLNRGEDPACVAACMMRCLQYGDIDDLRAEYGDNADNAMLPSASENTPSIIILPHRNDQGLTEDDIKLYSASEEYVNG